jgi:hypothetical protein
MSARTDEDRETIVPDEKVSAILKTEDVSDTIEWYTGVGFRLRGVFPETGEPTWCELAPRRRGPAVSSAVTRRGRGPPPSTGTLYFYPESVDALYEEIKDHTPPAWGPEVRDWGARELGLRDPNGYFLTFTEDAAP